MKKALLAVLVYFLITQLLAGILAFSIAMILTKDPMNGISASVLGPSMIVSFIIAILVCWKGLKVMRIPDTFRTSNIKWNWALIAIVACFFGALAGDLLIEITNLPDLIKDEIKDLANNTWGIMAVAILGPIAEELLFREGVCGYLSRNGMEARKAIWISAILFGLVHVNPAQVFIAILIGLMLGVIYIKTGNIVVTCIIHILNNSFAITQARILDDKADDFSMVEWVGGDLAAGVCIIVGFALCFYLLRKMWEEYPNDEEHPIDNDTDCQPITTNNEQN